MLFFLGLVCLIGGIYFLLVNLNIIGKKNKPENDKPIEAKQIDNILIRVGCLILCFIGLYFIWPEQAKKHLESNNQSASPVDYSNKKDIHIWSEELKNIITQQCLDNGKRTAENYPELVNDYCKCATDRISQAMTPQEYTEWMEKPKEEQSKIIRPIVQTCVDIMTKLIELTNQTKPNREGVKKK